MLNWFSSFFSGKRKLEIKTEGSFIRYVYGKTPRTIAVDTTLYLCPNLNDDEFVIKIEDTEWDLNQKSGFSIVRNKQKIPAISWNSEKENVFCIFILSDASQFEELLRIAGYMIWKSMYGEDPTSDSENEIASLIKQIEFPFNLETLEPYSDESSSSDRRNTQAPSNNRRETQSEPSDRRKTQAPSSGRPSFANENYGKFQNENIVYSCKGDFFLLEVGTNTFHEKGVGFELSFIRIGDPSRFTSVLTVTANDGQRVLATAINSSLNAQILLDHNAITFSTSSPLATWGFIFSNPKEIEGKKFLVSLIWESQYLTSFTSLDQDDQTYYLQSFVSGKSDDNGYESDDFMDIDASDEEYESEDDDEYDGNRKKNKSGDGERNSLLVDSAKHHRAFVARGNQIGIFDDTDANYLGKISLKVRPEHFILHDNERKLLLASDGNVKELDLTKEKIVSEYSGGSDSKISTIGQIHKYAEQTGEPLFAAMNNKSIWGMDTRISGKDQSVNKEIYKTNPKFKVFSTSSKGQLAVGSEDGIIRLYSGVSGLTKPDGKTFPKSAKTNLPGFGDEILGLDTSGDGKWVLATCKRYLIVVPTEIDNSTGFEVRMGKRKPSPRRLQLLPEDVYRLGGEISFTPAKFNTGADGETWIVTSTGNFVVTWNFRRVRKNYTNDYVIRSMHDQVSRDQFISLPENASGGNNAPIIVALDNDVVIEKRVRRSNNPFQKKPKF